MLNFPNAPIDGELSQQPNGVTYEWQAAKTRWITPIALGQESAAGVVVQDVLSTLDQYKQGTGVVVSSNDTLPTADEGVDIPELAIAITPKFANSKLIMTIQGTNSNSALAAGNVLFVVKDGAGGAILSASCNTPVANYMAHIGMQGQVDAEDTVARTYNVRIGANVGTWSLNGNGLNRLYGGSMVTSFRITEIRQ
jgi:hypothetical protein